MAKPRFFKFTGLDGIEYTLSFKEKLFCEYYLKFKGNGVDAIYEAGYKPKHAKVAASMAYENLIKPDISAYITLKLEEYGFNDDNVTKQHLYLMNQFGDLPSKRGAIDMFYKLKGKYAPTQIKFGKDENPDQPDDALANEQRRLEKEMGERSKKPRDKKK